jgi:SAM-dependent methyltransferase
MDIVYTGRVLQHIAPVYAREYIREMARVLAPGGFLSFDVPSRALETPALPAGALPASAYRAGITVTSYAITESASGATITLDLRLTNASDEAWPAGVPLNVGNHWLTPDGVVVVSDDQRVAVPLPLAPGQSVALGFTAAIPAEPRARVLELDVVHEGVAWCAWMGSPTLRLAVGESETAAAPVEPAFEPVMEMHAVPREAVEALLHTAGVRLLRLRREQHCGPHWETFRYDVTAD